MLHKLSVVTVTLVHLLIFLSPVWSELVIWGWKLGAGFISDSCSWLVLAVCRRQNELSVSIRPPLHHPVTARHPSVYGRRDSRAAVCLSEASEEPQQHTSLSVFIVTIRTSIVKWIWPEMKAIIICMQYYSNMKAALLLNYVATMMLTQVCVCVCSPAL